MLTALDAVREVFRNAWPFVIEHGATQPCHDVRAFGLAPALKAPLLTFLDNLLSDAHLPSPIRARASIALLQVRHVASL